ncbi:MAG: FRG domain-containing protein [Cyanobacteria bacterium P01_C01_bin.120]
MQEITIHAVSEYIERLGEINRGQRALYRGQRRDRSLLPKIARLTTYLPILHVEQEFIEVFKLRSLPMLEQPPEHEWDWLTVMQHYGLATRLLDWSINPLAALWFCVRQPPVGNESGVVWLLHPNSDNYVVPSKQIEPTSICKTYILRSKIIASRIRSQAGWFTAHYFNFEQDKFVALENDPAYKSRLKKLMVPFDAFARIRLELDRLDVNSSTLFPDLDGLCAHIEWIYSSLADEELQDIPKKNFPIPDNSAV